MRAAALALALTAAAAAPAVAQRFDPQPAWPLCGRITEAPPVDWEEADGCPEARQGVAGESDFPISDSFGPRRLASEGWRYDYHRGLDIPTPIGTPVFAVAAGLVTNSAGDTIQIRHLRPGEPGCSPEGCWFSRYIHLSDRIVGEDDEVGKGQLIGHSGESANGFAHLHFEVRDAPPFDPFSGWQRDCVHPLELLPYVDLGASALAVSFLGVETDDPGHPVPELEVELTGISEADFARLQVDVYEAIGPAAFRFRPQATALANGDGYFVTPPWIDLDQRNALYSHKDSSSFPWESFADCPYADDHPAGYDPYVHVDRQWPDDDAIGQFDGVRIQPIDWNTSATEILYRFVFEELDGPADPADLCLLAIASDVHGARATAGYQCGGLLFADGFETGGVARWTMSSGG